MREEDILKLKDMLNKASIENPVSRNEICKTFHISDRVARKMVEYLRDKGVRVCGRNDINGYWIAKTEEEYRAFRREYMSKAATIFRRVSNMDNQTDQRQVNLFELL